MPSSSDEPVKGSRGKRRRVRIEHERHVRGIDHRKLGRALLRLAQADYEREHGDAAVQPPELGEAPKDGPN